MTEPSSPKRAKVSKPDDLQTIRERVSSTYRDAGQEQLITYIDWIPYNGPKFNYLKVLDGIDLDALKTRFDAAMEEAEKAAAQTGGTGEGISPYQGKIGKASDKDLADSSYKAGIEAIQSGTVAAVLLAGGQGTRLGVNGPKGKAGIGLKSSRSLFGLIAERIRKLQELAKFEAPSEGEGAPTTTYPSIPLYVMTSPMNYEETKSFFKSNGYFGLGVNDVIFFTQGVLPCVDEDMKILLETQARVAMAPDGNGGVFTALHKNGYLEEMAKRGIEHLHVFSVDNALVRPVDPAFIGYCINEKADCGNKIIWRASPDEKVGVLATKDGKPTVVEYSELSKSMASAKEGGKLKYGAANICSHYFATDFIKDTIIQNKDVPYHAARKKIPVWDRKKKETITPDEPNGVKLETFIFDVFPLSKSMAVYEVDRSDEFAPVKNANADGATDTPDTARKLMSDLVKKWLTDAGANLGGDADSDLNEISPATSYAGEGLGQYAGKDVECPFSL